MSEDLCDGIPPAEKPEAMEVPSNEELPRKSVPHLVETEILHESSQDEHGQATQSASNTQEGDIFINENPLTEKIIESLPSNGEATEDMPTECNETVSLDAEPESEETLHEQSSPVSNTFFSIKAVPPCFVGTEFCTGTCIFSRKPRELYTENLHGNKIS